MGQIRKADTDSVATGPGGAVDMAGAIRQAVAAEIERQRREAQKVETEPAEADAADPA